MTLFTNVIAEILNVQLANDNVLQLSPSLARYKTVFFISGTMASASKMGPSTALMTLKARRTCK
jgi:hypothetical protein